MTDSEFLTKLKDERTKIAKVEGNCNIKLSINLSNGTSHTCCLEANNNWYISPTQSNGMINIVGRKENSITPSNPTFDYSNNCYVQTVTEGLVKFNIFIEQIESISWSYDFVSSVNLPTPSRDDDSDEGTSEE